MICLLGLSLLVTSARATTSEALAEAWAAWETGDDERALQRLHQAERSAPRAKAVVPTQVLGEIWLLRGAIEHRAGRIPEAMDAWRQAFAVAPVVPWIEELLPDPEAPYLFEALRVEVGTRYPIEPETLLLPPAPIWIDGRAPEELAPGRHLVQIQCASGDLAGMWSDLQQPERWRRLCPAGFATVAAAASDEWGDLAPVFGGPRSEPAPQPAAPDPATTQTTAAGPTPSTRRLRGELSLGMPATLGVRYQHDWLRIDASLVAFTPAVLGAELGLGAAFGRFGLGPDLRLGRGRYLDRPGGVDGSRYQLSGIELRLAPPQQRWAAALGLGRVDGALYAWWVPRLRVSWMI